LQKLKQNLKNYKGKVLQIKEEKCKGLEESVRMLNNVDINSHEASALIVVTQHYDTLHSVGASNRSNLTSA
jgi:nitrate reductase NapAB chaperone NapD